MSKKLMRVLSIILTFLMLAPLMFVGVVQVNADTAVDYSPYIQDGKVMGVPEPGTVIEKGTVFGGDKLTGNEAMLFDIRPFVEMFDADNYETGGAYIEAGDQFSIDSVQYADATKGFVVKDSYIKEIYGKQTVCVRLYPKVAPVGIEEFTIKLDWKKVGFELGKQITIEEGLISNDKYALDGEYRYLAIKSADGTWKSEWEMEEYTLNETDSYAIYYSISLAEDAAGSYLTSDVKVTLNDATAKIASTSLESYMGYEDYATDVVVLRVELGTGLDILKAIEKANNPVIPPVEGDGTQNGDAPTVDDAPQNQESESPINPVVVGGVAVAAVGGTAGAVLAIKRKK